MADDKFLIRRKQDNSVFGPLSQKEADGLAGYPEDFEKLPTVNASKAGYDTHQDGAPKTKRSRKRKPTGAGKAKSTAAKPAVAPATPTPAPTPAEG
jgi:hypothetical protein